MLTRIYIDNFYCLSNFEIKPKEFQLWLGDNGSGKSMVFLALQKLQQFLSGAHVHDIFDHSSLSVWDKRRDQTLAISLQSGKDLFDYELRINHPKPNQKPQLIHEELKWNGQTFYLFDGTDSHLYRIYRHTDLVEKDTQFTLNAERSVIPTIGEREDNWPLLAFRNSMAKIQIVQPTPSVISPVAEAESRTLSRSCDNFAQWYRFVVQENTEVTYSTGELLKEVLPGFAHLSMKGAWGGKNLKAAFRIDDQDQLFDFSALSDGQRQLIILYTLLESLRSGTIQALFIDEPDNYVSLREIQPWLDNLQDICDETDRQAIIISHHPEIVNRMARGDELWFHRKNGGPVQTKPYPTTEGLTPAETMVRGWDHE